MLAPRHASARGGPKTLLARATERPRAGAGAQGTDAACARACGCGDAVTLGALRRRRPTPTLTLTPMRSPTCLGRCLLTSRCPRYPTYPSHSLIDLSGTSLKLFCISRLLLYMPSGSTYSYTFYKYEEPSSFHDHPVAFSARLWGDFSLLLAQREPCVERIASCGRFDVKKK